MIQPNPAPCFSLKGGIKKNSDRFKVKFHFDTSISTSFSVDPSLCSSFLLLLKLGQFSQCPLHGSFLAHGQRQDRGDNQGKDCKGQARPGGLGDAMEGVFQGTFVIFRRLKEFCCAEVYCMYVHCLNK